MHRVVPVGFVSVAVVASLSGWASTALAHDGSHDDMPHMVTAGILPVYAAHHSGSHPALVEPIDDVSVGAVGVTIGYGHTFWHHLEVRVRSEYIKPFSTRDSLRSGLHVFRGVVGVNGVLPLLEDELDLALGPEVGAALWRLTELEVAGADAPAHAAGYSLSLSATLRGWVTYHTGLWLELGFGVSDGTHGDPASDLLVSDLWPLRVGFGWADRF